MAPLWKPKDGDWTLKFVTVTFCCKDVDFGAPGGLCRVLDILLGLMFLPCVVPPPILNLG